MALLLLGPKPAVVDRRRRRPGAVHDQGQGAVPDVSHALQHGGRGAHHGRDRCRLYGPWRAARAVQFASACQAAGRSDRHVFRRQHRPRRRRDRGSVRALVVERVARRVPVERRQLHGCRHRRRGCGGRHRARRALEGGAAAGAGLPHLSDLPGLRRPARGSEAAHRGDAAAAPGHGRRAGAGAAAPRRRSPARSSGWPRPSRSSRGSSRRRSRCSPASRPRAPARRRRAG